jgi:sugar transferase (PEP-CTERM/EpsH1 system associated)
VSNGVDYNFFDPANAVANPFDERPAIVFTGTMNYRPNIDAMTWFAGKVMPRLRAHPAGPHLWIVGSSPTAAVKKLAGPDIRVTGRVPDVRPYLAHARAVVAPMQIARGIQNKVLEAMAMGAAVVVTPQAREGLDACGDDELFTATTPEEFADAVTRLLDGGEPSIGLRARRRILDDFGWEASLTSLDRLLDGESLQGLSPTPNTAAPGSIDP